MIEVELPDGFIVEFPDGTSREEIKKALSDPHKLNLARAKAAKSGALSLSPERAEAQAKIDQDTMDKVTLESAPFMAPTLAKFNQGLPFVGEWVDEAMGKLNGPQATTRIREWQGAMDRQHPKTSAALQLAGGVNASIPAAVMAAPSVLASAPASMMGKLGMGGLLGLVGGSFEGAVQGAGAANEGDRSRGAQSGALTGGILGAAFGAGIPLAGAGVKKAVSTGADILGWSHKKLPGLTKQATDQIAMRAEADNIGTRGLDNIRAGGDGAMLVDAGPSMIGLADQAVNVSPTSAGVVSNRVHARSANAGRKLKATFDDVMGGAEGMKALIRSIRDDASPATRAAYDVAYNTPIPYDKPSGQAVEALLKRIPARKIRAAVEAANDRMTYDELPGQIMASIADDGSVSFSQMPNVIQMDYMKRAFDELAREGTDALTGKMTPDAAFARRIARDIRNTVREAVPAYGEALEAAGDALSLESATDLGRVALRQDTTRETITAWAEEATVAERRAFAAGLRSDIDERMANTVKAVTSGDLDAVEARKILRAMSSEAVSDKMRIALGDEAGDAIATSLDEATQSLMVQAGINPNSATAGRLVGDAALRDAQAYEPTQILRETASGGVVSGPRKALEVATNNTALDRLGRQEAVYGEVGDYLTKFQGADAVQKAQDIAGLLARRPAVANAANAVGRAGAGGLGLLGHLLTTQRLRKQAAQGPR